MEIEKKANDHFKQKCFQKNSGYSLALRDFNIVVYTRFFSQKIGPCRVMKDILGERGVCRTILKAIRYKKTMRFTVYYTNRYEAL